MRFAFFGTPEFAAIILEKLIGKGFIPRAVICNPDRPTGRKRIVTPPPVKQSVMKYELEIREKIKILQPEKLDPSLFLIPHSSFDLFIVVAYAKILPKEILEIPKFGAIGIHPSLLPRHRGPTPIQTAILEGDKVTGVTLFLMDEKVDHGPILAGQGLEIRNSNFETLNRELANLGAKLLIETLPKFMKGEIKTQIQNENYATYTKKFTTEDAYVPPQDLWQAEKEGGEIAIQIERKIRALNPEPGVWTKITPDLVSLIRANSGMVRKRMKILRAEIVDGKLKLKKIQIEGKKPFDTA